MTDQAMNIQWYPGHMAKAKRLIRESLRLVDVAVEILDARIPQSSQNPEMDQILGKKKRLIILNKCDMADPRLTKQWISYFKEKGMEAIAVDSKHGTGLKAFVPTLYKILEAERENWAEKGMGGRTIRAMVLGVPNVGKSSFINRMAGSRIARVEDRPGVTRGKQWIKLENGVELLDMPGILWPKFEDPTTGVKLAFTGAVKDDVLDVEYLAVRLLDYVKEDYWDSLSERYKLQDSSPPEDSFELLEQIGRARGMLQGGGQINTERAAIMLLDEFRGCKIAPITLERPKDE